MKVLSKTKNALIVKYGNRKSNLAPVNSFLEAVKVCQDYISYKQYGASTWGNVGQIYDINGKVIARVSYNGRVWWQADGKEVSKETVTKNFYE